MKKAICIILLLSTLLTVLASCKGVTVIEDESETEAVTKETTDTETADTTAVTETVDDGIDHRFDWQYEYKVEHENANIEGDYIFNNAEAKNYSLILKRNVVTGECTTVCTDPFCEHNSASCPFYKTTHVVGIGNTMYGIMRDENINKNVLYSFNVDTNKKEIVYESTATLYDLCQYKYYIFFRPTDKGLLRLDTRTGEIEKVKTQPGRMSSVSRDMIIWIQEHKGEMATFTATDLLGNDPKPYNIYIYNGKLHGVLYDEETGKMSYAQLDKSGKVEKILIENSHMALIVGDSMIYFGTYDDGKTHWRDPEKPEKGQRLSNGDIYIAPLDTFEFRLLCHIEEAEPFDIARSNLNMLLSGDWVAIDTPPNYPTTEDKIGTFNDMILVNMKTGEYHISRYIE